MTNDKYSKKNLPFINIFNNQISGLRERMSIMYIEYGIFKYGLRKRGGTFLSRLDNIR